MNASMVDARDTAAAALAVPPGSRPLIEIDLRLVEEAILLAVARAAPEERRPFREDRDALYEVGDPEAREAAFAAFNRRWLGRLGLLATLERRLTDLPALRDRTSGCMVLGAVRARDEHADLRDTLPTDRPEARPVLVLRLRPETLVHPHRLEALLDRELLHVVDMLDPTFAFERDLPHAGDSAALQGLFRERYRAAWDTTIDGRLAARGRLPEGGLERRRRDFHAIFAALGDGAEALFQRLFNGRRPSHHELVELALAVRHDGAAGSGVCSLCRLPTHALHRDAGSLPAATAAAIRGDFPEWTGADGLCSQCADLYEARARFGRDETTSSRSPMVVGRT